LKHNLSNVIQKKNAKMVEVLGFVFKPLEIFYLVLSLTKWTNCALINSTVAKSKAKNSFSIILIEKMFKIQGISGAIMTPGELKMQPTIHFQ
jgi:hypothetical protein